MALAEITILRENIINSVSRIVAVGILGIALTPAGQVLAQGGDSDPGASLRFGFGPRGADFYINGHAIPAQVVELGGHSFYKGHIPNSGDVYIMGADQARIVAPNN